MSLRHFHEVLPTRLARPEISLIPFRVVQAKVGDRLISGKFADRGSVDPPLPFVLLHGLLIAFSLPHDSETNPTEARVSSKLLIQR